MLPLASKEPPDIPGLQATAVHALPNHPVGLSPVWDIMVCEPDDRLRAFFTRSWEAVLWERFSFEAAWSK